MNTLNLEIDTDGIALIMLDDPARKVNLVSPEFINEFIDIIEQVAADADIKGGVVSSTKPGFMAGADLKHILKIARGAITLKEAFEFSQRPSVLMHRRMETCGKPFVAAINGLALGGGFELALACHYRVIVDDAKALVGLPEVNVGLLPGSGGTQRLSRMIGMEKSMQVLLEGLTFTPAEAHKLGMVDVVVPAAELIEIARQWILKTPRPVRAWDEKGYRNSGGLLNPDVVALTTFSPAMIAARTQRNYPAPIAILDCVFAGSMMPIDKALRLESKYFARLLCDPVSRNIIRSTFVNKGEADKLVRRPAGIAKSQVNKLAVLGAGMMGSAIAYVAAAAGIDVVLLDSNLELAKAGKTYSARALDKQVQRNRMTQEQADAILRRIKPGMDYSELKDCDLLIEAVFEDMDIKADVIRKAEAAIADTAIMSSNTSTLPISELAQSSRRPHQFIGLHFFSPVDRMPLVEVILGRETSDETLAKSLDFVASLKMTPIIVNDSRGFYTSRVFQTFIHEGMSMLEEGVKPALIENSARQAGFPLGPLALVDEVTVELPWKIVMQAEAALDADYVRPCAYNVMRRMIEEIKRPGRRFGGGFYEYPEDGQKTLWPGLTEAFPSTESQPDAEELKKRFLYIQALESARCFEEDVITDPMDADVGSIIAWSFPSWTGGTLSLIDTVGIKNFVAECERMAKAYGPRFSPSDWMLERAKSNKLFYNDNEPTRES